MSLSIDPRFYLETAIRPDSATLFVSLELSRSQWLITALSPGSEDVEVLHRRR